VTSCHSRCVAIPFPVVRNLIITPACSMLSRLHLTSAASACDLAAFRRLPLCLVSALWCWRREMARRRGDGVSGGVERPQDVMEEMQLGPNGGLLYCMEYLVSPHTPGHRSRAIPTVEKGEPLKESRSHGKAGFQN